MAITIDWPNKIINIPKADLTLIQSTPTEIRELDLNQFRLTLKDLEDGDTGIVYLDTHRHNPPVIVGGVELARVVEIINDYTITFEDGQYAVNLVGANSNVADRVNVNQVSVRASNSAGLITNTAIEYSSFNGGVTVDITSNYVGTGFPTGTPRQPVNNMADALLIAEYRGFTTFYILGDITLDNSMDFTQYTFVGESPGKTTITVASDANVEKCEFYEATVTGTLDGECKVKDCVITDINYISGYIELCVLEDTITLGGGANAIFLDCWGGVNFSTPPIIDLGDSGQTLVMQNFNGRVKWQNKNGPEEINATLNAGWVVLDSTITNGTINIIGIGTVEDNSTGSAVVNSIHLIEGEQIDFVWEVSGRDRKIYNNREYFYDKNGDTLMVFKLLDSSGDSTETDIYERVREL